MDEIKKYNVFGDPLLGSYRVNLIHEGLSKEELKKLETSIFIHGSREKYGSHLDISSNREQIRVWTRNMYK